MGAQASILTRPNKLLVIMRISISKQTRSWQILGGQVEQTAVHTHSKWAERLEIGGLGTHNVPSLGHFKIFAGFSTMALKIIPPLFILLVYESWGSWSQSQWSSGLAIYHIATKHQDLHSHQWAT